ncbi:hypothetical protein A3715_10360 [Oleiphilus sp. HI0009]|nr:hypothetical protein A3715_10360 [Oleiphilus sp. HI0009]
MSKRTNAMRFITQIDGGYWVRFCGREKGKNKTILQKSFFAQSQGGWSNALIAAINWRDEQIEKRPDLAIAGATKALRRREHKTLSPRNKSGVTGVCWREFPNKPSPAWVATISLSENGIKKSKSKTFSYERDNLREEVIAFHKACEARRRFVEQYYKRGS